MPLSTYYMLFSFFASISVYTAVTILKILYVIIIFFKHKLLLRKKARSWKIKTMKEVLALGRRSIMNEQLKYEIAKELGVDKTVEREGWGAVSSRDCGNMVKKAIEIAQRNIGK